MSIKVTVKLNHQSELNMKWYRLKIDIGQNAAK